MYFKVSLGHEVQWQPAKGDDVKKFFAASDGPEEKKRRK